MATTNDPSGKGEIFDLLSNHRRRYAIHCCKREDRSVTLSELAEQVTAWEHEKRVEDITAAERKRVYTSLQQTHLPTLAEADMIEYDGDEVTLTERATKLDVYLDVVPADSVPWGVYYLGLSALGGAVLAGVHAELLPTDPIPPLAYAALVVVAFAVSAAVHTYSSRRLRLGEMEQPP